MGSTSLISPRNPPDGKLLATSYSVMTNIGRMFLFVREVEGSPFDVFVVLGNSGSDITSFTESIGRLLSIAIRCGVPINILTDQLQGIGSRTSIGRGKDLILSVPDAIGKFLWDEYCSGTKPKVTKELCPKCRNATLEYSEGCVKCTNCGTTSCW